MPFCCAMQHLPGKGFTDRTSGNESAKGNGSAIECVVSSTRSRIRDSISLVPQDGSHVSVCMLGLYLVAFNRWITNRSRESMSQRGKGATGALLMTV